MCSWKYLESDFFLFEPLAADLLEGEMCFGTDASKRWGFSLAKLMRVATASLSFGILSKIGLLSSPRAPGKRNIAVDCTDFAAGRNSLFSGAEVLRRRVPVLINSFTPNFTRATLAAKAAPRGPIIPPVRASIAHMSSKNVTVLDLCWVWLSP